MFKLSSWYWDWGRFFKDTNSTKYKERLINYSTLKLRPSLSHKLKAKQHWAKKYMCNIYNFKGITVKTHILIGPGIQRRERRRNCHKIQEITLTVLQKMGKSKWPINLQKAINLIHHLGKHKLNPQRDKTTEPSGWQKSKMTETM